MDDTVSAVTERIVTAVSTEADRDPATLPPLYETIDPETLVTACQVFDTGQTTFLYAGHEVTVYADFTVEVRAEMSGRREPGNATGG